MSHRTSADGAAVDETGTAGLRVDKWLWYARFFRSRVRASEFCTSGKLRVSGEIVRKAHRVLRPGDVLTFPQGRRIRVVRVKALADRRGSAAVAHELYEDLSPASPPAGEACLEAPAAPRDRGEGRPTKAARRAIQWFKGTD